MADRNWQSCLHDWRGVRPRGLPFPKDNARGRASTIRVGRPSVELD
jgi:hypothetical protein